MEQGNVDRQLVARLARALSPRGEILEAYLFGARARGQARRDSDIDVAVYVDETRARDGVWGYRAELTTDLMAALGTNDVDVVVLNRAPILLYHRVLRDGVRVLSRDLRDTTPAPARRSRATSTSCRSSTRWTPRAGMPRLPRASPAVTPGRALVAVGLLLASTAPALAGGDGEFSIPARRAERPPVIDGHVTEPEWRARRAPRTSCSSSRSGGPAELPTVVHVLYDDQFLYAGFQAWDPEPPLSQMIERDDPIWNDDSVQVFLDTFHDRRTGYYFMVNRLGTQTDGRIAEDGGSSDGGVGRPVAVPGAADRLRLVGRDRHPLASIQYRAGRRRHLGHQLRPQPAPVARAHLLGGAGRLLGPAVDGRHPRGARRAAAVAPPPGHPLRAVARPGA